MKFLKLGHSFISWLGTMLCSMAKIWKVKNAIKKNILRSGVMSTHVWAPCCKTWLKKIKLKFWVKSFLSVGFSNLGEEKKVFFWSWVVGYPISWVPCCVAWLKKTWNWEWKKEKKIAKCRILDFENFCVKGGKKGFFWGWIYGVWSEFLPTSWAPCCVWAKNRRMCWWTCYGRTG